MVRALLAGTKTQTRRIIKPQPPADIVRHCWYDAPLYGFTRDHDVSSEWHIARLLAYKGDRLWVRETVIGEELTDGTDGVRYVADDEFITIANSVGSAVQWLYLHTYASPNGTTRLRGKQVPSIHMPKWASRLTLTVTDVRVERLQDISEADALAEGVPTDEDYAGSFEKEYCQHCGGSGLHGAFGEGYGVTEVDCAQCETAKLRYRNLWDHINGVDAWVDNPWVAAYTFTVHRGNIDQISKVAA
jgi:hypothetical protein